MPVETSEAKSYQVEISGWDLDEKFFVEKTALAWGESEKKVQLRRAPRKGAIVFVRLLGGLDAASEYPLAYEVTGVTYQPKTRFYDTSLMQVHPRANPNPAFAI